MENKKNLPNIPIYIGDWERDCNVLSLESEAAWMRVVFKLWTKGKQNTIKIPAKSLQNLWRCSPQKMDEILQDLIFNEIAEISITTDFVEFTCRRFVKENALSQIRSEAAKGAGKKSKPKAKPRQTTIKPINKNGQNADNDIENEIKDDNVIEIVNSFEKGAGKTFKAHRFTQQVEESFKSTYAELFNGEKYTLADFDDRRLSSLSYQFQEKMISKAMPVTNDTISQFSKAVFMSAWHDKYIKTNYTISNIEKSVNSILNKAQKAYEQHNYVPSWDRD